MSALERIRPALTYIDAHLEASLGVETLASRFHFSPYYFHRMFTLIVGKSMGAYIRERRLQFAARQLYEADAPLVQIAIGAGFETSQAFSRAFRRAYGMPPGAYRTARIAPEIMPVEALIRRFTNRLQGGISVNPRIINRNGLCICGSKGRWDETAAIWNRFEKKAPQLCGGEKASGYEVRVWDGDQNPVYVGYDIARGKAPKGFDVIELPRGAYACFEVFVQQGYDSENNAMMEWLASNEQGYRERLLEGKHFVVEFYDERFTGDDSGSIVEIWVPIHKA